MCKSDEVRAHLLNHLYLFADQVLSHGCTETGMVFMPLRSAYEHTLAVQLEWPVIQKFKMSDSEPFGDGRFAMRAAKSGLTTIYGWLGGRPQFCFGNYKLCDFAFAVPTSRAGRSTVNGLTGRGKDPDQQADRMCHMRRVVQSGSQRHLGRSIYSQRRSNEYALD